MYFVLLKDKIKPHVQSRSVINPLFASGLGEKHGQYHCTPVDTNTGPALELGLTQRRPLSHQMADTIQTI